VLILTLGILSLAATTTESFICSRLDLCLFSKTRVEEVLSLDGPVQQLTVRALPDAGRVQAVAGGYLVRLSGDRVLALVDPPLVADQRISARPLGEGMTAAFAAQLAALPPRRLVELLDGPLSVVAEEAHIAEALKAALGGELVYGTCDEVSNSAWRLMALAALGAEAERGDRTRLSLFAVALDCPDEALPEGF
jgi:hypothetical protein